MKISATTLACPAWDLDTILKNFKEYKYDAVDFRGLKGVHEIYSLPEFTTGLEATVKKVAASGLELSGFSSSAQMYNTGDDRKKWLEEVKAYGKLCQAFGSRFIRVFGGTTKDVSWDEALDVATINLRQFCDAVGRKIIIAVETHDDWCHTDMLKALFERIDRPNVGVLWDIGNPFLEYGESVETSFANIGQYVVYTHIKDAKMLPDKKLEYKLAGEGDVPLTKAISLLKKCGYKGYLTVEWEKRWHPEIADPEIALPAYAKFLRHQIGKK